MNSVLCAEVFSFCPIAKIEIPLMDLVITAGKRRQSAEKGRHSPEDSSVHFFYIGSLKTLSFSTRSASFIHSPQPSLFTSNSALEIALTLIYSEN